MHNSAEIIQSKKVKVKTEYKPSGPSGQRLFQFQKCEGTRTLYFYSRLDGMPVHRRVTFSIKFASTHLHTWVGRGPVRVKCLAQEHNTMSLVRALETRHFNPVLSPPWGHRMIIIFASRRLLLIMLWSTFQFQAKILKFLVPYFFKSRLRAFGFIS